VKYLAPLLALAACGGDSEAPGADAAVTSDAPVSTATNVTATMMATRVLDHAYYGTNTDGTLHVELDKGGDGMCPTMSSQTDYSLILGRVDVLAMTTPATFLDYRGDMLGGPLNAAASSVTLSNVFLASGVSLALDLTATFPAGSASGHVFATHCASLDE